MDSSTRQPRWRQIAYGLLGGAFGAALVTAGIAVAGPGAGTSASAKTINACVDVNFTVKLYPAAPCPGGHTPLALAAPLTDAELAELQRLAAAADPLFAKQKRSLRRIDRLLAGSGKLSDGEIRDLMEEFNKAQDLAASVAKKTDDTNTGVIGKIG